MSTELLTVEDLLYLFEQTDNVDETAIYFDDDPEDAEHYIGCIPEFDGKSNDKPYWIGLCDVDGGCEFATAKELFEAKVFDGKSLKERREHVVIFLVGGFCVEDYMKYYGEEILINRRKSNER